MDIHIRRSSRIRYNILDNDMKILEYRVVRIAIVITVIGLSLCLLSSCDWQPSPGSVYAEARAQEVQPEITRYRLNHNKLLYDVILKDGSRCVVSTGGGLYCEFVK